MNEALSILFRDDHFIAINKPAGLLVHRSAIDRHETRFAMQLLRDQIGRRVYPVHRLDKPTSGVLLFALDQQAAQRLSELFGQRSVSKTYLAVVRGYTDEEGMIDHPLKEQLDKMTDTRARSDKEAQTAITGYRRLATVELPYRVDRYPSSRYSLLEVTPRTGRKHQIRRHMKHIAHPIIGDSSYGKGRHNRLFAEQFNCRRLLLAATQVEFVHPYSGRRCCISAPPGDDFSRLMDRFGWHEETTAQATRPA